MEVPQNTPEQATLTRSLAVLRRLEWRVRHAVENMLSGEYRSAFRGRGMEFDQVVRYEFGDDVRDIDWNVTARLGEPYRKKFVEERESTLFVVVEDSPSLQFGSTGCSRREALLELAGLVMLLGAVNRDRVGTLIAKPGGYDFRPAVRGRGQIMHLAAQLLGHAAPPLEQEEPEGKGGAGTQLTARESIPWHLLSRAAPRHSIVLWLSDFAPGPIPEGWAMLQRRYQTMGFRVDDPWDLALPAHTGLFAAYDPTAHRLVSLEGSAAEQRAHAEWTASRNALFNSLFPDTFSRMAVGTTEDRLEALVRYFRRRMAANHRG